MPSNSVESRDFLADATSSDHLSLIKFGAASDAHSMGVLYRTDGRNDATTQPNPALNGFLTVVALQDLGPVTLKQDGKSHHTGPTPRGSVGVHDLRSSWSSPKRATHSLNLVFSVDFLEEIRRRRGHRAMDLLQDRVQYDMCDDTMLYLASAFLPSFEGRTPRNQLFLDQLFLTSCTYIISKYGRQGPLEAFRGGLSPWQERRAKELLAANTDGNISLDVLSKECGLSRSHFARAFKVSTGQPPHRWLMALRLNRARELLINSSLSIGEIASLCGFADQSHFTRVFTTLRGVPPGEWRRQRRG